MIRCGKKIKISCLKAKRGRIIAFHLGMVTLALILPDTVHAIKRTAMYSCVSERKSPLLYA